MPSRAAGTMVMATYSIGFAGSARSDGKKIAAAAIDWGELPAALFVGYLVLIVIFMTVYLTTSLVTSFLMNWYNRRIQLVER